MFLSRTTNLNLVWYKYSGKPDAFPVLFCFILKVRSWAKVARKSTMVSSLIIEPTAKWLLVTFSGSGIMPDSRRARWLSRHGSASLEFGMHVGVGYRQLKRRPQGQVLILAWVCFCDCRAAPINVEQSVRVSGVAPVSNPGLHAAHSHLDFRWMTHLTPCPSVSLFK